MRKRTLPGYFITVLLFLAFLVGCLCLFFARVDAQLSSLTVQHIIRTIRQQNSSFSSILDTQFSTLRTLSAYLAAHPDTEERQLQEMMAAMSASTDFFRVMVADTEGNALYADGQEDNVAQQDYFRRALEGKESLSEPLRSSPDGHARVVLAVPVYEANGGVSHVLAGSYDVNHLSELMYDSAYAGYGHFLIAAPSGRLVAMDSRWAGEWQDDSFSYYAGAQFFEGGSLDEMRQDFSSGTSNGFRIELNGNRQYVAYAPLSWNGWMMCYVVDEAYVQAQYGFIRTEEAVLVSAVLLGICVLLIVVFLSTGRDHARLKHRARTDSLTGLLNKASTQQEVAARLRRSNERDIHALMILDLDDFKSVNDTCGHAAGDAMLQQAAAFLSESFRGGDVVGRVGGDEFMVFLPGVRDMGQMTDHLAGFVAKYNALPAPEGCALRPKCSAGIAFYPRDGRDFEMLYKNADSALYSAKGSGKCRTATFEEPAPS